MTENDRKPYVLPSEGRHLVTIQDMAAPERSRLRPGQYNMRLRLKMADARDLFMYVDGYLEAMLMLYESREYWLGRTIEVKVKHRAFDESIYASVSVYKWKPKPETES